MFGDSDTSNATSSSSTDPYSSVPLPQELFVAAAALVAIMATMSLALWFVAG